MRAAPLERADVHQFAVIIAADLPFSAAAQLAALARDAGVKFVLAETRGLFGRLFCDFGILHRVDDATGEPPATTMVSSVTSEAPGIVTTYDDARHGLQDGDTVTFSEVQGMTELNESLPRTVRVIGPYSFSIEDTRGYHAYSGGGWVRQVKQPVDVSFKSLAELAGPYSTRGGPDPDRDVVLCDFSKIEQAPAVHAGWFALHRLDEMAGGIRTAHAVDIVSRAAAAWLTANGVSAENASATLTCPAAVDSLAALARGNAAQLSPLSAVIGGLAAQEAIKAITGKHMPVRGWLYFDAAEAEPSPPPSDTAPTGSRYDGQVAVFGAEAQARLSRLRYFLVGAGAIGCEVLKNWACMGVGIASEGGAVVVADMDRIERSNLSRQFLFRASDVGAAKAATAAAATGRMNPDLVIDAREARVGPETEDVFNDDFWGNLSGVCNALDNVDARIYTDGRCVYYGLPLLESGTLGTKGNTQVVVPQMTENYGASRDPPEKTIPVCTLKSFPNAIEHTLQWARDWMEGEFKELPDAVNAYLEGGYLEKLAKSSTNRIETLERLLSALSSERPSTVEDCVRWARLRFADLYDHSIQQLLFNFPADTVGPTGQQFWSGPKRAPSPITYDREDPLHAAFILAATRLRASLYGLHLLPHHTPEALAAFAAAVRVPPFLPRAGIKIAASEKELEEQRVAAQTVPAVGPVADTTTAGSNDWDTDVRAAAIESRLPTPGSLAGFRLHAIDFDKDDDAHVAMVTAASNLRARNYRIAEVDAHASKLIAGKIIPAIATTTALVAGLVCLELYKLHASATRKPIASFRNAFVNLALPLFTTSEPIGVATHELRYPVEPTQFDAMYSPPSHAITIDTGAAGSKVWKWSIWDRIELNGPMTLRDFLGWFKVRFNLDVQMVSYGATILHAFYLKPTQRTERAKRTLGNLCAAVSKRALPRHARFISLEIVAVGLDGVDAEVPYIRYRLSPEELAEARSHS